MASSARITLTRPRLLFALLLLLLSVLFVAATLLLWRSAVTNNQYLARSQLEMLVGLRAGDLQRGDLRAFSQGVGADFPNVFISIRYGKESFASGEWSSGSQCAHLVLPLGLDADGLDVTLCRPFAFRALPFIMLGSLFVLISGLGFAFSIHTEKRSIRSLAEFFREQGVEVDRTLPLHGLLGTLRSLSQKVQESRALEVRLAKSEAYGELAAMVAHDIRAPLAAIKVTAKEVSLLSARSADRLDRAAQRIERIAADLLRKDASAVKPSKNMRCGTLSSLLEEAFAEFNGVADEAGVRVMLEVLPEIGSVSIGRPEDFSRVISNLLTNSLEACLSASNQAERMIAITAAEGDRGEVRISIADTGKGIPPDILSQLGQRGASFGKEGGNGLGLYGAKEFAESTGGTLTVHSTVGLGTTVTLALFSGIAPSDTTNAKVLDAVLVDDDVFVREAWHVSALEAGVKLAVYDSVESFLQEALLMPKTINIYLDSLIEGSELTGEEVARKLSELGFSRLYLATGLDEEDFHSMPWLSGVIGKDPPDWAQMKARSNTMSHD